MTAAQEPRVGGVLTAESVKLLRAGDVLCCINPQTKAHKFGSLCVFEDLTGNEPGGGNDIRLQGSRLSTWSGLFTFVSRPSESSASVGGEDEAYEIGKRDGYEAAVQDMDLLTGGDGEYVFSTCGDGCPDADTMKARIVERFAALRTQAPAREGEGAACRSAVGRRRP